MITCKVCSNQEYQGVIFCGECGSQVAFADRQKVNTLVYPNQNRGLEVDITQYDSQKSYWKKAISSSIITEREEVIEHP